MQWSEDFREDMKFIIEMFLQISMLAHGLHFYEEHLMSEILNDTREFHCQAGRQLATEEELLK